jgi:DNA-binding transcriptional regulator LsrR (DeoR family)
MPAERLPMRKLHELLRLRLANGLTQRAIARSLGLSQGTVCDYLGRQSLPNSVRSRTGRWSIASSGGRM